MASDWDEVLQIVQAALGSTSPRGPATQPSAELESLPLSPSPMIASAIAKVIRFDKHIKDLDSTIEGWINKEPYAVFSDYHSKPGAIILRAKQRIPIPDEISTILGDCVHNLRSALDHIAWAAARCMSDPPLSKTAFPIYHDRGSFDESRASYIESMWTVDQARIERVQPYHVLKTNDPLFWVQQLDNTDKHRQLVVVALGALWKGLGINELRGYNIVDMSVFGGHRPLQHGTPVAEFKLIRTAANAKLTMHPDFSYEIRFDKTIGYVENRLVMPTLAAMRERVIDVLRQWKYDFIT